MKLANILFAFSVNEIGLRDINMMLNNVFEKLVYIFILDSVGIKPRSDFGQITEKKRLK